MKSIIKRHSSDPSKIMLLFDEDMVIDPSSDFLEKLKVIKQKYFCEKISPRILCSIETEIDALIQLMYSQGYLFRDKFLRWPETVILKKEIVVLEKEGA